MLTSNRLTASMSPVAMIVAILALLLGTAGVGYTAATIGTGDIKRNAVTSPKVKNGTLKAADMVKEKRFKNVGSAGAPAFGNGGQGDCIWKSAGGLLPGAALPGFRTDRFGTVHLAGIALSDDGVGGDGICDNGSEAEDGIVFVLPPGSRPAKHQFRPMLDGMLVIANKDGLTIGVTNLPPGAVFWSPGPPPSPDLAILDGVSFEPAGTKLYGRTAPGRLTSQGRALLSHLGIG